MKAKAKGRKPALAVPRIDDSGSAKPQADSRGHTNSLRRLTDAILQQESTLREGGGPSGHARQRKLNRLSVRDRLTLLLDADKTFLELGLWWGYELYKEIGTVPAAGVVTGIGTVHGRNVMVIANDATVKAGAFFPATCKKVIRAQKIAARCNLPIVYLVDSAGVFLPMEEEIFPDEDDFGRIFRNNAVLSAAGVPQIAAIMGNCVAGGAYLPVLCDKILMTEGSALFLAGPALVQAAIGQVVDAEDLGGAEMHSRVSGTVDFHEKDDASCLQRLRSLIALLPEDRPAISQKSRAQSGSSQSKRLPADDAPPTAGSTAPSTAPLTDQESLVDRVPPESDANGLYDLDPAGHHEYDVRQMLRCVADADSIIEYKAEYGQSLLCAYGAIGGIKIGIVANQRMRSKAASGELQMGGVIHADSADKAARFIMDCEQMRLPLVFFQDVQGFMVGRDAEHGGIIRSGAKLVNAVSNVTVPKVTVILGGSFGAGNYALCGKAFDPVFIFAWPSAKYAVMGAAQAAGTMLTLETRKGSNADADELNELQQRITKEYEMKTDIRYGAARGWVDAIVAPETTREVLITALTCATRPAPVGGFRGGVMQV